MNEKITEMKERIQELEAKKANCIKEFQYEEAASIRDQLRAVNEKLEKLVNSIKD